MPWITIGPRNEYEMFVDDADVPFVTEYNWYFKKALSVICTTKHISIANFLLSPPKGMVVDHIDGNPLNNSRSNLRVCTQRENAKNKHGVTNVYERRGRWRAKIMHDYKYIHIGTFDTRDEAEQAVIDKKRELYGEYSPC